MSIPGTAGFRPLTIESTSPGDVWIFGTARHSDDEALHLAGGTWHILRTPPFGTAIAVLSGSDVWMTGQGGGCRQSTQTCTTQLLHWNGRTWSSSTIGTLIEGLAGWGRHVWAAGLTDLRGMGGDGATTGTLTLYQRAAGAWRPFASAHPRTIFSSMIDSLGSVIAAGPGGRLWLMAYPVHGAVHAVSYWSGRSWTHPRIPASVAADVSGGYLTYDLGHGVWIGPYLHWTGRRWVSAGQIGPLASSGFGFQAIAAIPGSGSLWAAGSNEAGRLIAIHGPMP